MFPLQAIERRDCSRSTESIHEIHGGQKLVQSIKRMESRECERKMVLPCRSKNFEFHWNRSKQPRRLGRVKRYAHIHMCTHRNRYIFVCDIPNNPPQARASSPFMWRWFASLNCGDSFRTCVQIRCPLYCESYLTRWSISFRFNPWNVIYHNRDSQCQKKLIYHGTNSSSVLRERYVPIQLEFQADIYVYRCV